MVGERALRLTWVFDCVLSAAAFVLSPEWKEFPWVSRVGHLLLVPCFWLFAIIFCSAYATFRRMCLGGGTFFLGLVLLVLQVKGLTWESFGDGASALSTGVGLLVTAVACRAYRLDNPDPTSAKDGHV